MAQALLGGFGGSELPRMKRGPAPRSPHRRVLGTRLEQTLAPLQRRDLVEAPLVTVALECGGQPDAGDLLRQLHAHHFGAQHQHVGVVVGAGDLGGQDVVAEPGPHAADLVAGDLLAAAGAADHDAPVHLTVHDLPADVLAQPRVVDDRLGIVRATIVHPVATGRSRIRWLTTWRISVSRTAWLGSMP